VLCEDRRAMQPATPDPAARLETVVEAVAARAAQARDRLDDLTARLDELDGAAPATQRRDPRVDPADPARLAAIELAVGGADRMEATARLADRFPGSDLAAVLDDVFGRTEGTVP
jgi:hypothetical protein